MKTTAKIARTTLETLQAAIDEAEGVYDAALVTGTDAEAVAAEANVDRLRRTRDRLTRQIDILREREALDAKDAARRARQEADENVIRCRAIAAEAFEQFAPELRERLEGIAAFARERIGAALEQLDAATRHADGLSERRSTEVAPALLMSFMIDRHMVSVLAGLHLADELKSNPTANRLLLAIESGLRAMAPVEH